tara:strand:+ start:406 stop:666 length:261 start_codon:yes stop_codon:yes gene_type:complete
MGRSITVFECFCLYYFKILAQQPKKFKKDIKIFLIPFLILLSWVTTRSEVIKDYSNFTSISNTNSEQFFFKFYNALPSELYDFKKK